MAGPRLFISYTDEDGKDVAGLATALRARGVNTFFSRDSLDIGEEWLPRLKRELLQSDGVLFVITAKSNVSKWLNAELGAAWILEKPIFPVAKGVEVRDLHDILRSRQCYSLATEEDGKELISKIVLRLTGQQQSTFETQSPSSAPGNTSGVVYDFRKEAAKRRLLAVGNWKMGTGDEPISGEGRDNYLLSGVDFSPPFRISTRLEFSHFTSNQINSGLIFGWRSPNGRPRYYNLLLNQSRMWLEVIGSEGGSAGDDFIHIGPKKKFEVVEGGVFDINANISESDIFVEIEGSAQIWKYASPISETPSGYVGLRPWNARLTCHDFRVTRS